MNNEAFRSRAQRYGYAGLLPFFAGAALVWVVPEALALPISQAFIAYACVILSFLGGVVWRPYIGNKVGQTTAKQIENQSDMPTGRQAPKKSESLAMDLGIAASLVAWLMLLAVLLFDLKGLELLLVVISALAFYVFRRAEKASTVLNYAAWFDELRDFLVRAVLASHFSVAIYLLQQ